MSILTKSIKNSKGALAEVDYFSSDGKYVTKIDYYGNGVLQQELTYAVNGNTLLTTTNFIYYKNTLLTATVKTPDGKIQSLVDYKSDGTTVNQISNYIYDVNGLLSSINSSDASGHLLQTVTYAYANQLVSGTNTTSASKQLIETATYNYNTAGQISKITHTDSTSALIQTDKYVYQNNSLSQISKFNSAGKVLENDYFGRDGKTITEIDSFKYSATGVLEQENISNALKQTVYTLKFDSSGLHINEWDFNQYANNGQLIASFKAGSSGQIFEENDFRGAQLAQTINYDAYGNSSKITSYAADGITVLQVQANYRNIYGQLTSTTVTDAMSKIIENDQYEFDSFGRAAKEIRYNGSGVMVEQDVFSYTNENWRNPHDWKENQIQQRYNANGELFEIDYFKNNFLSTSSNYVNGILSTKSSYASNGQLSQTISYAQDGVHVTQIENYNFGVLTSQDFFSNNQLQSEIKFASDGQTVLESDSFFYNANGQIEHLLRSASGQIFETDQYKYSASGQLSEIDKINASGVKFEIDYYNNGNFNHAVQPLPSPTPVLPVMPSPVAPVSSHWNAVSGWGEANVLSALNLVTNHNYAVSTAPAGTAADLKAMGFQTAWANGFTGQGVVIADIDTGLDLKNSALVHSLNLSQYSWNFLNNSSNIQDDNGHGSVTAEELAASSSLGNGVEGGAFGAQLMVLKALDANGSGSDSVLVSAINYAVAHGANIINMSLGQNGNDQALQSAVQYASDHGVIVVAAAGNDGASTPGFPAAFAESMPNVIAVGASQLTANTYSMAAFSNQAGSSSAYNFVDAIGVNISGIGLNNSLNFWSGTSMATPLIAAEAAVLESTHSGLTVTQIVQDIMQTSQSLKFSSPTSTVSMAGASSVQAHTAHALATDYSNLNIYPVVDTLQDHSVIHTYG